MQTAWIQWYEKEHFACNTATKTLFSYVGGRQGGSCNFPRFISFFGLARRCKGTEHSIEECGGIVKVDTCSCGGTLQCEPGMEYESTYRYISS